MIIRIELLEGRNRVPIDASEYEFKRTIGAKNMYEFINILLTFKKGGIK